MQEAAGAGRDLLETASGDVVTFVQTPEELVTALEHGRPHIQITEHLNFKDSSTKMATTGFDATEYNMSAVLVVKSSTRSLRVSFFSACLTCMNNLFICGWLNTL